MPEPTFPSKMAVRLSAAIFFAVCGCATIDPGDNARARTEAWARERGFIASSLRAGGFDLLLLVRRSGQADTLTIYIEGDGAPWGSPYHPPRNPTPLDPVALALANADNARHVAWLARPCQYLNQAALAVCDSGYWTERRFAPEVIAAYDSAVTKLKAESGAREVRLVGYSGGGVIAALVALRRNDIAGMITVAAPLSLSAWVAWHGLSPLAGSLDPGQLTAGSRAVQGMHFAGANDKIVPAGIVEQFVRSHGGKMETIAEFDHDCCWVRDWARLLSRARGMGEAK